MRVRRPGRTGRWLVSLLIVALLPTPLPRVEYHNVRHHDAPGEVCEYHDHLLRWHPDATEADDLPVLHWHWGWSAQGEGDADHADRGPRLHASHPDDSVDRDVATIAATPTKTALDRFDRDDGGTSIPSPFGTEPFLSNARPATPRPPDPVPPALPSCALHARLGRWSC